jgi:cytochrome c biogenesis protein CcmG/thiol:disulfide interchange protein DsbE
VSEANTQQKRDLTRHLIVTAILIVSFATIILILFKGLDFNPTKIPSALVGKPAYPFRAEWIQGREYLPQATDASFTLEQMKGKPVVLNFWASWCVSCREEARELENFWMKHKADGLLVVGIAIQDTQEAAMRFAQAFGKTYLLGLDNEGRISIDYGVTGVPETFIINRDGVVVHKEIGPVTAEMLEKHVKSIL